MTGKPDDISRLDPTKRIGEDEQKMGTPSQPFEQYMQRAGEKEQVKPPGISPFDLPQGTSSLATIGPSFDSRLAQVKSAQSLLGDVNNHLNTPNLKLKQSQRYLLRNKLTDANTHLHAANAKLGAEPGAVKPTAGGGVIGKFLDLVSEGNNNLKAAQEKLLTLKSKGDLKPADFLVLQLKLAAAQQEIEYSSIMLGKAVEDLKMLFQVQL